MSDSPDTTVSVFDPAAPFAALGQAMADKAKADARIHDSAATIAAAQSDMAASVAAAQSALDAAKAQGQAKVDAAKADALDAVHAQSLAQAAEGTAYQALGAALGLFPALVPDPTAPADPADPTAAS